MKRIFTLTVLLVQIGLSALAQSSHVNWMPIEKAEEFNQTNPKKTFVYVYTEWNGWCATMEKRVFVLPSIVEPLNKDCYAVKFNGEQREAVKFKGQLYKYNDAKKYNDLTPYLLKDNIEYPTLVVLDEEMNILTTIPGYIPPNDFRMILNYFISNAYLQMRFDEYEEQQSSPENK